MTGPKSVQSEASPDTKLLNDEQRLAWLQLIRSQNVGPTTFKELINYYGGAQSALNALPDLAAKGGNGKQISLCPKHQAEAEIETARKLGAKLVAMGEPGYPALLLQTEAAPPMLYLKGNVELTTRPSIAIVGSRNGSTAGQKMTHILSKDLGAKGFVISSGLARGIDSASHHAALKTGTIAVVAGGIGHFYPPENKDLQQQIGEHGLIISEQPPTFQPRAQDFPRRNRIISGISLGVIVIEAAERSGTLITARYALEQNREIFAIPGNPLDPRAKGTNKLIKQGATLITCADDVAEMLSPMLSQTNAPKSPQSSLFNETTHHPKEIARDDQITDKIRNNVKAALSTTPTDIDEIIRSSGHQASTIRIAILELELAGKIERHGAQLISLRH